MANETYILLLSIATAAMNALFVFGLIGLAIPALRVRTVALIRGNALFSIIMLSLASLVGSLFMQYGLGLVPCLFCWWQRIFMYPIVLVAGLGAFKRDSLRTIADYALVLAIPGALVALYQHLLQMLPQGALIPCDASGECAVRTVFEFGYITLPWMALSAFALIILFAVVARSARD
jgi:disulfide bond formation protein DsbB